MKTILVIGASGYLGRNLVTALRHRTDGVVWTTGRRGVTDGHGRHVVIDLANNPQPLRELSPDEVWICARPMETDETRLAAFQAGWVGLLTGWSQVRPLSRVVYFSTQLVYADPPDAAPVASSHVVAPQGLYADWKRRGEEQILHLFAAGAIDGASIQRLPLLLGGTVTDVDAARQLLYSWHAGYRRGEYWDLPREGHRSEAGNSFLWVPDYVEALATRPAASGLEVLNAVSGHFTYRELDRTWRTPGRFPRRLSMAPSQMAFYLKDEFGLPGRSWSEASAAAGLTRAG